MEENLASLSSRLVSFFFVSHLHFQETSSWILSLWIHLDALDHACSSWLSNNYWCSRSFCAVKVSFLRQCKRWCQTNCFTIFFEAVWAHNFICSQKILASWHKFSCYPLKKWLQSNETLTSLCSRSLRPKMKGEQEIRSFIHSPDSCEWHIPSVLPEPKAELEASEPVATSAGFQCKKILAVHVLLDPVSCSWTSKAWMVRFNYFCFNDNYKWNVP